VYKVDNSTAREDVVSQPVSNSSGFLEFLIFLLPISTTRGRMRAEKKKREYNHICFKLFPMNLASKYNLLFYTA
jgi:hypothetical protein